MKQVSQMLRAAMVEAEKQGVSLYRIAKACELDDSIVYRFYHDECGLALSSVDRLCQFLGLELIQSGSISNSAPKAAAKKTAARKKAKPAKKKAAKKKKSKKKAAPAKATKKKAAKKKNAVKKKAVKKKAAKKTAKKKKSRR